MTDPIPVDIEAAKRRLRREMRQRRHGLDTPERSARICDALIDLVDPSIAALVMVYDAVPGEPDLTAFSDWCAERGIETIAPDPSPTAAIPAEPAIVDVVIVPGLAFTSVGDRLGQGGGWYDRFLASVRPDCLSIGVCFETQIVSVLPTQPHDAVVDVVVTDTRAVC